MQDTARRMQALIDDLLAYSRTNTAERKFEYADLNQILEEVKNDLKDDIADKHAVIDATAMPNAFIIPFQFRQLMNNIVSNALKFSKQGTPPVITIRSSIVNSI